MKHYASYEKDVEIIIKRIVHRVRIKVGEVQNSIIHTLQQVPKNAKVQDIIEDEDYIEMLFKEEKEIKSEKKDEKEKKETNPQKPTVIDFTKGER